MGTALAKCFTPLPVIPACRLCGGSGVCHECHGEGGWVVELEVMRTEKKKVVLDGLDKIQEDLVTVYIPEKQPCSLCGSKTTKTLDLQASVAFGNTQRYTHEVEVTTHLGSSSGVHRDFLGNVQSSDSAHRTDGWKGSGKCKKCAGTGKEPLPILTKNRRA